MSKMSELDLERRDIEDGLRPMDMGTVFYLTHLLNAEGNRQASAIIHDLLEQHTQRYPVLYRNVTNQDRDTASQYSITHPKPGFDEWEHLAESVIEGVRLTLNSSQKIYDADPNAYYALWYWVEWGMKVNTKLKLQQDENN